jgi:hypothetical protein
VRGVGQKLSVALCAVVVLGAVSSGDLLFYSVESGVNGSSRPTDSSLFVYILN